MTDPLSDNPPSPLEQELRRFTPAPPSTALDHAITAALTPSPYSFSDRLFLSTLSAGLAAACLILTLLTLDISNRPTTTTTPLTITQLPSYQNPDLLLAQLLENPHFLPTLTKSPSTTIPN